MVFEINFFVVHVLFFNKYSTLPVKNKNLKPKKTIGIDY